MYFEKARAKQAQGKDVSLAKPTQFIAKHFIATTDQLGYTDNTTMLL